MSVARGGGGAVRPARPSGRGRGAGSRADRGAIRPGRAGRRSPSRGTGCGSAHGRARRGRGARAARRRASMRDDIAAELAESCRRRRSRPTSGPTRSSDGRRGPARPRRCSRCGRRRGSGCECSFPATTTGRRLGDLEAHAPFALWVRGDPRRLAALDRSIALVGARAATGYGEHVTIEAASGLVDRGFAIVSGAAYGIDGAAHRAALASQGTTVAVLAGGLDRFYPSGHEQLLGRIADRGVVVAEVPPAPTPTKWRFLLRNRLIAALSGATVVVEAGWRSGSLNTAGHAATLGRPLGAVPGPGDAAPQARDATGCSASSPRSASRTPTRWPSSCRPRPASRPRRAARTARPRIRPI